MPDWREGLTAGRLHGIELFGCTNHELAAHLVRVANDLQVPWLADEGDLADRGEHAGAGAMEKAKIKTACDADGGGEREDV